MNSNTLFRIFGYFVLSVCVFTVRATDTGVPSVVSVGKPDRGLGGPSGVRGTAKPVVSISEISTLAVPDVAEPVVADDPAIVTAELAKKAAEAQAKEADTQEKNAAEAKKIAGEKAVLAKGGIANVEAAATKAEKASGEAKLAGTSAEALLKAQEAIKQAADAVEKAKIVEAAAKNAQEKATEAEKAYKAAITAVDIAKARAVKADTLDKVNGKPTAKIAKEHVAAAEKSAAAAKASSETATESAVAANEAKLVAEKLVKKAEGHKADASSAVKTKEDSEKPQVPVSTPVASTPGASTPAASTPGASTPAVKDKQKLPDEAEKPLMNYVKDEKYDYQAQLLKEDRCSEDDAKKAKCKKNSNCYLDHSKPVCICFPGFSSDDASKKSCEKVDKPTCKNEANTCHRNANCKESKTLGIGCQCKDKFAGDGLLCSSAFSYFMNFFLVLAVVSVQLYM